MFIDVLSVSVEDKGKYKMLEVAYKGSDGKVNGRKIMSFGATADTFKLLSDCKGGEKYDITTVKNDKGYLDWVKATPATGTPSVTTVTPAGSTPRSTYETQEERALRQVLIVRQSAINAAIEFEKANNPKGGLNLGGVLEVAKAFENHVFGRSNATGVQALVEMEDDIPV